MTAQSLFNSALDHLRNGQLVQAESLYRQLLAAQPNHPAALHLLGLVCHQTGRSAEAVRLIQQALELEPNNPDYLNNLGAALRGIGQVEQAIACYKKALQITPKDLDLQNNLGNACVDMGRFEEAAGCYRRVLRVLPRNDDVRASFCHALQAYGYECHNKGLFVQAEAAYAEAITANPKDGYLHYNLGNAQRELAKTEAALKSYKQALVLIPNDADTYNNLGNVLRETGQLTEAIDAYQKALEINPNLYHARVHLVHQKQHICDWAGLDEEIQKIRHMVNDIPAAQVSPFAFLAMPDTSADEQKRCADQWVRNRIAPLVQNRQPYVFKRDAEDSKLRIGYISSDFRLHPLAFLISELIELHNREQFEIYAYSNANDDKTAERQRLERAFDHFIDIRRLSDEQAANRIHQDRIDILVDLTGFTQSSRSAVAALKPAPITINWLGYPGTMGMLEDRPLFDYILTDSFITPNDTCSDYAEQLLPLPTCYQPNDRQRPIANIPSRENCQLPKDSFVFCSFNQTFKILPDIFGIWMRLLKARPNSVLWLLESNAVAKENLRHEAEMRGVDANRLIFAPRVAIAEHLARHQLADLFLDTLPYNAHTTASDALWMGLPVLTCAGQTFASRVAGSLLHALNLEELITDSLAAYEERALQLSSEVALLQSIKDKLAINKQNSALFDTTRFTKDLENTYQEIWQRNLTENLAKNVFRA